MSVRFIQSRDNDQVFARITGIGKLTKRGLRQGMFKAGQGFINEANREILKGPKTGRIYVRRDRKGRRRRHMASAPGESHANLSGTLRRSLSFQLRGSSEIEFGYGVSSGKEAPEYAGFIEFGTTKMKARPSLLNALNAEQGNTIQHFKRELLKAQR